MSGPGAAESVGAKPEPAVRNSVRPRPVVRGRRHWKKLLEFFQADLVGIDAEYLEEVWLEVPPVMVSR